MRCSFSLPNPAINDKRFIRKAAARQDKLGLPNLRFICENARFLPSWFGPGEVGRIYINFPDPWPKDRHAKRRLPSRQFLERFSHILKDDGQIEFKTDNKDLFAFALEEITPGGFELIEVTHDLHNDEKMNIGNIMTEYEAKFSALGNPICKYIIRKAKK